MLFLPSSHNFRRSFHTQPLALVVVVAVMVIKMTMVHAMAVQQHSPSPPLGGEGVQPNPPDTGSAMAPTSRVDGDGPTLLPRRRSLLHRLPTPSISTKWDKEKKEGKFMNNTPKKQRTERFQSVAGKVVENDDYGQGGQEEEEDSSRVGPRYTTDFYDDMPVDHLGFGTMETFQLKYLYNNESYWPGGPIFFYCGNEGSIEDFAANSGMMFELAPLFNAFILFGEHRYYGTSLPFSKGGQARGGVGQAAAGDKTFADVAHLNYLTTQQTLADYVRLLAYVKQRFDMPANTPVIAFGGSYGGMLAAWFRMKYPSVVAGAWAASAPVLYFKNGGVPLGGFDALTKRTLLLSGCNEATVLGAFKALIDLASSTRGRSALNEIFHIDERTQITSVDDVVDLLAYAREAIEYMVMTDYPYESDFLAPMPAWPVEAACKWLADYPTFTAEASEQQSFTESKALAQRLANAISIYYNFTGTLQSACINSIKCGGVDQATDKLGIGLAWPWQACTELAMPMCAQGPPNDLFWSDCNETNADAVMQGQCAQLLSPTVGDFDSKQMLRFNAVEEWYGFSMEGASRIIFTNGELDPWSVGGVYETSPGMGSRAASERHLFVYSLEGAAHHLDLREPNTCDPPNVREARRQITLILACWVGWASRWSNVRVEFTGASYECTNGSSLQQLPLPAFKKMNPSKRGDGAGGVGACRPDTSGFPWGAIAAGANESALDGKNGGGNKKAGKDGDAEKNAGTATYSGIGVMVVGSTLMMLLALFSPY